MSLRNNATFLNHVFTINEKKTFGLLIQVLDDNIAIDISNLIINLKFRGIFVSQKLEIP